MVHRLSNRQSFIDVLKYGFVLLFNRRVIAVVCCSLVFYQTGACTCSCPDENIWYQAFLTFAHRSDSDTDHHQHSESGNHDTHQSNCLNSGLANHSFSDSASRVSFFHHLHDDEHCRRSQRTLFSPRNRQAIDAWEWRTDTRTDRDLVRFTRLEICDADDAVEASYDFRFLPSRLDGARPLRSMLCVFLI